MTVLYSRICRVTVGTIVAEGLRVQFKVKKTLQKEPNTCDVNIFNLTAQHRAGLQVTGTPLILEAGYGTALVRVFSGQVRLADSTREGPDWISKIQCGDGEVTYRYATVSAAFGKGSPVAVVFKKVAEATGLDVSQALASFASPETFAQGYAAHGPARVEMDRLLKGRGYTWSIQDGKLQVIKGAATVPGEVVELNASSGLVGSPEHGTPEKKGAPAALKVKCLLQPQLVPGSLLKLSAETVKGNFRVETVSHTGDTHGGEWYSDLECRPV